MKVVVYDDVNKNGSLIGSITFEKYLTYTQIHKCIKYRQHKQFNYPIDEKMKGLSKISDSMKFSSVNLESFVMNHGVYTGSDKTASNDNYVMTIFKSKY